MRFNMTTSCFLISLLVMLVGILLGAILVFSMMVWSGAKADAETAKEDDTFYRG